MGDIAVMTHMKNLRNEEDSVDPGIDCISPQLLFSHVERGTVRTAQHQRWRSPGLSEQKAFLLPCHLAITLNSWKKVRVKIKCIEEVQI